MSKDVAVRQDAEVPAGVPAQRLAITMVSQSAPVMKRLGVKDPERIVEVIRLCLAENAYLAQCVQDPRSARSMVVAICRALSLGLDSFGGPMATAYLVPFNTKVKEGGKEVWVNLVQLIPSYKGIAGIALRDGLVKDISAGIVYESDTDTLILEEGMDRRLSYRPDFRVRRRMYADGTGDLDPHNPPVLAWCAWTTPDGRRDFDWMPIADVLRVRNGSKAWDPGKLWASPWGTWPEEMTAKTLIKHASKRWGLGVGEKHNALRQVLERAGIEDTGQTPADDAALIELPETTDPADRLADKVEGR